MIEEKTLIEVFMRDMGKCVLCGSKKWLEEIPHHCFWKSQYFREDRDEDWNLVTICKPCHFDLHHRGNKEKDRKCKELALSRYRGKYRDDLEKIMRVRGFF